MRSQLVALHRCLRTLAKDVCAPETSSRAFATESKVPATGAVFAACVLERLPVVLPKPKHWEVAYESWLKGHQLKLGILKEYPSVVAKSERGSSSSQTLEGGQNLKEFVPVPSEAPSISNTRSMKRHFEDRLYLLVKDAKRGTWRFPMAEHSGEESIRDTAERAMLNTVGRRYPVFFIGNAPMAHFSPTPTGEQMFFMLAQAVDDPWETKLMPDSGADDYAWVNKEEMLSDYIKDPEERELMDKLL